MDPRWRLPLLVVAILLAAWYFRFEIVVPANRETNLFYKMNRWTGSIEVCFPSGCRDAAQSPPQ